MAAAIGHLDNEAVGLRRRAVNAAFVSHRIIPSSMVVIIYYTTTSRQIKEEAVKTASLY
jgi:hypothetical protein